MVIYLVERKKHNGLGISNQAVRFTAPDLRKLQSGQRLVGFFGTCTYPTCSRIAQCCIVYVYIHEKKKKKKRETGERSKRRWMSPFTEGTGIGSFIPFQSTPIRMLAHLFRRPLRLLLLSLSLWLAAGSSSAPCQSIRLCMINMEPDKLAI